MRTDRMFIEYKYHIGTIVNGGFWELSSYEQNREKLPKENTGSKTSESTSCE